MARQVYNDTWASGGDKVDPGAVKTTAGWVVEAPPHEFFNHWQGRTDEMLQHLERSGIAIYDSATIYELAAYTREGTITYRSLVGSNTGNLPSTSPTEWVQAFLIFSNNLSDLPDVAAARTNLDVFSKGESNAAFLPIAGKAADSELLDGIDGVTFARRDQANTFTEDQTIKDAAATTNLNLDADLGFNTVLKFKENAVTRGEVFYDESQDFVRIRKVDTDGTSTVANLDIKNTGQINVSTGTLQQNGSNVLTLITGVDQDSDVGAGNMPSGTVAQRPGSPAAGMFRFNADDTTFEGYNGTVWGSVGGGATGGGTDDIFYENSTNVASDYTITTGKNAMSAGPITINTGITVGVNAGSEWTVV